MKTSQQQIIELLTRHAVNENDAMNILQDAGLVSDEAVDLLDVHFDDLPDVLQFLKQKLEPKQT